MTELTIENIVAYAQISDDLDLEQLAEKLPEFKYNPEEFSGLTLKLDYPKSAVLILSSGKAISTGTKRIEDAKTSIKKTVDKLKDKKIKVKNKFNLEIQNIVCSIYLKQELDLDSVSKGLLLDHLDYEPKQFPGLIYKMDDIGALLLLFSSGKIVCTGAKAIEEASNAIEKMEEKLTSIGAL